jgi:ActR/RegA family two-component response regulator
VTDQKPFVFLLEDDDDLRSMLGTYLGISGRCTVYAIESVRELESHSSDLPHLLAAILDINLGAGEPTGIDAYRWLRSHGFAGRIIFLTGHGSGHPSVQEAYLLGDAIVMEKPAGIVQLESEIFKPA